MDRGLFQDRREADKNTLAQVLCRFRDEVVPSHKGRDAETIRINALLKDRITSYKMSALSGSALSDFILRRQKLVSSATVRREIDIISSAVTKARKAWGIHLPENPVALIERPRPAKARERRLNGDEETRLMQALEDHADDHEDSKQYRKGSRNPWIKPFVQLAIHTAMRRGELLSLRWEDINLEERTAHLPDTKNGDARTVPLSSLAAATLRQLPQDPSGQVFPITADAVKKALSGLETEPVLTMSQNARETALSRTIDSWIYGYMIFAMKPPAELQENWITSWSYRRSLDTRTSEC